MTDRIATWYAFALQQVAAETHLDRTDLSLTDILFEGNTDTRRAQEPSGHTRMPAALASEFLAWYRIAAHRANDGTGFSGTLFEWTNEKGDAEYTLSIRSTEYRTFAEGGDKERDHLSGANGEIITRGFALGQLAALEDFYQREVLPRTGTAKVNVTGYSLGGHLATVFTETHVDVIKATYLYNAAGRGVLLGEGGTTAARMGAMVEHFRRVLTSEPDEDAFAWIPPSHPRWAGYRYLHQAALKAYLADPGWNPFTAGAARVYDDPRYRWAVVATTELAGYRSAPGLPFRAGLGTTGDALITSIYGSALNKDITLVANSQVHPANKNPVFIEGQPLLELASSGDEQSDFGNTHAITLLVDSLALQRAFQRLDPTLTREQIEMLVHASSAKKTKGVAQLGDGQAAESDSLEKALFALRRVFDSGAVEVQSDATPGGFGDMANRQAYFEELAALPQQGTYRIEVLAGKSWNQVAQLARRADDTGLAVRYALWRLDPFAVVGADYSGERFPDGELELRGAAGERGMSLQWIEARARLLEGLVRYNTANGDLNPRALGGFFDERRRNLKLGLAIVGPHYVFADDSGALPLIGANAGDFLIGGAVDDRISALGGNDYIEGGGGADILNAGSGNDELWGGAGGDELYGGDDDDRLFGGAGDDRLEGGRGNDRLEGGLGFDSYVYTAGDGHDTVFDSDGLGRITYKGRVLGEGISLGSQGYVDSSGARYELTHGSGGQTLSIDGAISIEKFVSGSLGIALPGGEVDPGLPPAIVPTRDYTQSYPYPADQPPSASDPLIHLLSTYANLYGSNGNDLFGNAHVEISSAGIHARGGDDVILLSGPVGFFSVNGGAGNDFVDVAAASFPSGPFWPQVTLAGGGGDDYILGGAGGERIWGDNYIVVDGFRKLPAYPESSGGLLLDNFIVGLKDAFPDRLQQVDAATLEALGNAGAPTFSGPNGFFPESLLLDASDLLLPYLQFEGWLFPGGLASALDYVLGVDPTFDDYIDGGPGDDVINAGRGSDIVYGGPGDDVIDGDAMISLDAFGPLAERFGSLGDDTLDGGEGNDRILDLDGGNDTLIGGPGDDVIRSEERTWRDEPGKTAFNQIDGGDGNDSIVVINATEGGYDVVVGGDGDDEIAVISLGSGFILGGEGSDSFFTDLLLTPQPFTSTADTRIGKGEFYVAGGAGNDIYGVFNGTIEDSEGDDTMGLRLPSPTDVTNSFLGSWASDPLQPFILTDKVYREDDDLVVRQRFDYFGRELDRHTRVKGWFAGPTSPIEHIRFEETDDPSEPIELETWGSNYVGTTAEEVFVGSEYADRVRAGDGIDYVFTEGGDDLIAGGKGDDVLDGGAGDDKYFYAVGHGSDVVFDESGLDELRFGPGIDLSGVVVELGATSAFLHVAGGTLELVRSDTAADGDLPVDRLVFADGTTVALSELLDASSSARGGGGNDMVVGNDAANEIAGGPGDDILLGGGGDDTYFFALGDGVDRISDRPALGEVNSIVFGPGITPDMLSLGSGSLLIRVGTGGDALYLESVDTSDIFGTRDVDVFRFDDGTQLTYDQLVAHGLDLYGTASSDVILGSSTTDRVLGDTGDDLLVDGAGDDTYFFRRGDGADTIVEWESAAEGIDTLAFADDIQTSDVSIAAFESDVVIRIGESEGSITVRDALFRSVIERVQFGDGTVWSAATLREHASPPNRSPITQGDIAAVKEDVQLSATGDVLDNDIDLDLGDTLSVANPGTYVGAYGALELVADGRFQYALDNAKVQSLAEGWGIQEVFVYIATDGAASTAGSLAVTVSGTNDAPVVAIPIGDQEASASTEFSFAVATSAFSDVDTGDTLAYSASLGEDGALPGWLTFDAASRTFSGTPGAADAGPLDVRVTATDLAGASASDEFRITVVGEEPAGKHLVGTNRSDLLIGTPHDDTIEGRKGRDLLIGLAGNDLLDGGKDDDLILGGKGNDRYLFSKGGGDDLIAESGGHDVLRFGAGIERRDVTVVRDRGDLVLKLRSHGGSVTVRDWFDSSARRVERVEFADGASWDEAELRHKAKRNTHGSWSHDWRDYGHEDEKHRHRPDADHGESHQGKSRDKDHDCRDARVLITCRLDSPARYDFSAVADYLRRQAARGADAKRWGHIAGQWLAVQRAVDYLEQIHEDAGQGAQDGFDGDHVLAHGDTGWGHASSTGRRHTYAGLQSLAGLGEGFRSLG